MPVHAPKKDCLILVGACTESRIEIVGMRPEFEWHPIDLKYVAHHPFTGPLGLGNERWQLIDRLDLIADIGRDQTQTSVHRMAVRIDESGKESLALQVNPLCAC